MLRKMRVEFEITEGREEEFLAALQKMDGENQLPGLVGYRAGDEVSLRTPLIAFAEAMETKLRKNDHKAAWHTRPIDALDALLHLEVREYEVAHQHFPVKETRLELVDIANYCCILYDRLGTMSQDVPYNIQTNTKGTFYNER